MKHSTTHSADAFPVEGSNRRVVNVWCCDCKWKDEVDVTDLTWVDAMNRIYRVRDSHESKTNDKKREW